MYYRHLLSGVSILDILTGLLEWSNYWEMDETKESFIPHPYTWLFNERWKVQPPRIDKNDKPQLHFRPDDRRR